MSWILRQTLHIVNDVQYKPPVPNKRCLRFRPCSGRQILIRTYESSSREPNEFGQHTVVDISRLPTNDNLSRSLFRSKPINERFVHFRFHTNIPLKSGFVRISCFVLFFFLTRKWRKSTRDGFYFSRMTEQQLLFYVLLETTLGFVSTP